MKHEHAVQVASRIVSIQRDYEALRGHAAFSLQELFNFTQFDLNAFCASFSPHPESKTLSRSAKEFCDRYGIWLPNAEHYISCALYLYPAATLHRMETMLKNLAIGYYLNDIMGRDLFKYLAVEDRHQASTMIQRMSKVHPPFIDDAGNDPVEQANLEMLGEVLQHSPEDWFNRFLPCFSKYIEVTHQDCSCVKLGSILSVKKYVNMRYCTSGMGHIVQFIEYAEGDFLNWQWLTEKGLNETLERVHRSTALIGALMNDFFSFEKEVIDNNADSNLLMAVALNNPDYGLNNVIDHCAGIIRSLLKDYLNGVHQIKKAIANQKDVDSGIMRRHLVGLDRCVQASWLWQVFTQRYKRSVSIWKETTLS
ncbi:hypothetical protein HHL16_15900 [Pseudoflavitalea sp. G-6-1-2]|uniref:terpene synthase family protein n=1 Tax=Pseudoflavitalea sp. G-6-1-2 TaxID=2728841 RepID=UPI00146A6053|nr:terpene synthase family protein [Pseudoflavitalea sp. G-6-1-2]NML22367.1 hypothetical protein [Pseudoflavitalea sp. G-6-1-2]